MKLHILVAPRLGWEASARSILGFGSLFACALHCSELHHRNGRISGITCPSASSLPEHNRLQAHQRCLEIASSRLRPSGITYLSASSLPRYNRLQACPALPGTLHDQVLRTPAHHRCRGTTDFRRISAAWKLQAQVLRTPAHHRCRGTTDFRRISAAWNSLHRVRWAGSLAHQRCQGSTYPT